MEDRRVIPRWQIGRDARVKIGRAYGFEHCLVEDMNLKGMRLSLNRLMPAEPSIRLELALEEDCQVAVEVRAPWKKEIGGRFIYGLVFTKIRDEDRDQIYQYLSNNFRGQFQEKWWVGAK